MEFQDLLKAPSILTIVSTLVNVILLLGLRTKYEEAKQTNQATKEDIGPITRIIEEIKISFSKETEILKAHLSFDNQYRSTIKTAERDALIEYNKKLSAWHYYMRNVDFLGLNQDNFKELKLIRNELRKLEYDYDVAEAHLLIFKHDDQFIILKDELKKCLIIYIWEWF